MKNLATVIAIFLTLTVTGQIKGIGEFNNENHDFPWELFAEIIDEGAMEGGVMYKSKEGYIFRIPEQDLNMINLESTIKKALNILNDNNFDKDNVFMTESTIEIDIENFNAYELYPEIMFGEDVRLSWNIEASNTLVVLQTTMYYFEISIYEY